MPREPQPRRVSIVRYVDSAGKQVPKGTPGARRRRTRSDTYYIKLKGVRHPLKATTLEAAWHEVRALKKRLADLAAGIVTPEQHHAARPLQEHLADFLSHVRAKGTGAKEVREQRSQITRLAALAGWRRITDITRDSCLVALARVVTELGRSQQTRNHFLRRARAFTAWLADTEPPRLLRDPLRKVRKLKVTEHRHKRRCPETEEIVALMAYLASPRARLRKGMTGPQRALGYRVAMCTGFRSNELRCLSRESFDLDGATVTLPPAVDKRRKGAVQPLPAWLVAELLAWFDAGGGCWEGFPEHNGGRLLKADLKAAGIEYCKGGLYFDMHALRVYYITQLASQPGIDPKTLMTLARHSTADLTLRVYAALKDENARRAVGQLPDLGKKPENP
jgi:integrase